MKYMGSKKRLQKHISPILNNIIKKNNIKYYIEPFVGGANMIESIVCENKIGYDNNIYLIELLDYVSKNGLDGLPKTITRDLYSKVRDSYNKKDKKYEHYFIGYIGFMGSYNGRFFDGGYSGHFTIEKNRKTPRDRIKETISNLENQIENIKDVDFKYSSFETLKFKDSLIYCDPPYKDTKKYSTSINFNYEEFYNWCIEMSKNNTVLISEYYMPEDRFECIWKKETNTNMRDTQCGAKKKNVEKLFTVKK